MYGVSLIVAGLMLSSSILSFFGFAEEELTYSFDESKIREYIPIVTNNVTCDKLYGRIVTSSTEVCYEFLFYWEHQDGVYKFSEHENDWEFVTVYTSVDSDDVDLVCFDSFHYYIGRKENPEAYNDTNVLLYVNPDFHSFKPDIGIRSGNVSQQINNQTLYELTDNTLLVAQEQVGFDPELYRDPFSWKEKGILGRYTAFDEWHKAFFVVLDKKFEFIDLSDEDNLWYKWL